MTCFIVFARAFGMSEREIVEVALFFAHQCTTTTIFAEAMKTITLNFSDYRSRMRPPASRRNNRVSFYTLLAETCATIKGKVGDLYQMKDIGAGGGNRFGPSNAKVYDEKTVSKIVDYLLETLRSYDSEMDSISVNQTKKEGIFKRLKLTESLIKLLAENKLLKSISNIRSAHLVQIASLFGLISLEFYVYIPPHFGGGTGKFLRDHLGVDEYNMSKTENGLIDWFSGFLMELQNAFNRDVTSNIVEQTFCYSARGKLRKDHWLQYITYTGGELQQDLRRYNNGSFKNDELQYFFHIRGHGRSSWTLEMFDGKTKYILRSSLKQSCSANNTYAYTIHNGHLKWHNV